MLRAAVTYFALLFALGFALGTLRVLALGPAVGETAAVLCELPLMLAASWFVARWLVRHERIATSVAALASGALAFTMLLGAEMALALTLGQAPGEWLAAQRRVPGVLGLAGQVAFALMPWLAFRTQRSQAIPSRLSSSSER